jgi:hypothetical protein
LPPPQVKAELDGARAKASAALDTACAEALKRSSASASATFSRAKAKAQKTAQQQQQQQQQQQAQAGDDEAVDPFAAFDAASAAAAEGASSALADFGGLLARLAEEPEVRWCGARAPHGQLGHAGPPLVARPTTGSRDS